MSRPRKSPFPKMLERVEMFQRADTDVRLRKYNEARRAVLAHVSGVERRLREAENHIAALHDVATDADGDVAARLIRLIVMYKAHQSFTESHPC